MTDHTLRDDVDDLRETVEALAERVEELEGETQTPSDGDEPATGYDRYDKTVLDLADDVCEMNGRQITRLYERAGIVDKETKKQRAKRLRRLECEK